MSVPLHGRVLRRLAVYGDKIEFTGVVNLGLVPFREEKKVRLLMKVLDEQLDLPVRSVTVSPDFLQVSVTPAPTTEPDSQGHYYLEIGAPATAPECDFTNSNGRGMGTVSLEFDHPRIPSLDLQVYFTVERRLR